MIPGVTGTPAGRLALACLRPGPRGGEAVHRALAGVADDADLDDALTFHGAWGHLHWHAGTLPGLSGDLRREAELRHGAIVHRHLRAMSDLSMVQQLLDGAGVRWLTFKGPVLSETAYPRSDLRGYADLDLLVDPDDMGIALGALVESGWPLVEALRDLRRRPLVGELHLRGPAGTPIDLHWHLLYQPEQQVQTTVDPRRVVASRTSAAVGRLTVPVLPVPDHLAYVCTHAAMSGAHRLRWLADVSWLASSPEQDWDRLVSISRRWRVSRAVGVVLSRSVELLSAPVPDGVLDELDSSTTWRAVERTARALAPVHGSGSRSTLAASVAKHSDDDLSHAWRTLLDAAVRRRSRRQLADAPRGDGPQRVDVLDAADGPALLRSYVADVTAWRPPGPVTGPGSSHGGVDEGCDAHGPRTVASAAGPRRPVG